MSHYWPFIRRHWQSQVVMLSGFGIGNFLTVVAIPLIYKEIIDTMAQPPANVGEHLWFLVLALAFVLVMQNVAFSLSDWVIVLFKSIVQKDLIDYVLGKLNRHSYAFFTNTFGGSLVAKTKRFVNAFETLHDNFIFQIWVGSISLIGAVGVLLYQSITLGVIFLLWLVSYVILVRFLIRWQVPKSLLSAEADSRTTGHFSDIITNVLTVKMFGMREYEERSFAKTTTNQYVANRRAWIQEHFYNSMFQSVSIGVFNIVLIASAVYLWQQNVISAGTIVLVQVYVIQTFNTVWNISRNAIRISTAFSNAYEMVELLDADLDVKDPLNSQPFHPSDATVAFNNATFYYENSKPVIDAFSLKIQSGERVALVGHSGAGKSTLVKLLLRFADVQKGEITIGGQNIASVLQDDLRGSISYVPQEPLLFHRTLSENISYGKRDATKEDIEEVARRARAHDFITELPHGYDTLVGERGIKLSGGERQRVAIARALLKDAPIIILDEATSSLDSISEAYIQEAFDELMKGRTTIVIAHRLSTISRMDRIVVLDRGTIVEDGTHAKLRALGGIYEELWKSQVGGFLQEAGE
ncbi:MAG: ABC transporter ATP-binding protein [bacterium]|nr:ABC transporter ATP-binding protein [bacterium]